MSEIKYCPLLKVFSTFLFFLVRSIIDFIPNGLEAKMKWLKGKTWTLWKRIRFGNSGIEVTSPASILPFWSLSWELLPDLVTSIVLMVSLAMTVKYQVLGWRILSCQRMLFGIADQALAQSSDLWWEYDWPGTVNGKWEEVLRFLPSLSHLSILLTI